MNKKLAIIGIPIISIIIGIPLIIIFIGYRNEQREYDEFRKYLFKRNAEIENGANKITKGMKKKEVEDLIGKPFFYYKDREFATYYITKDLEIGRFAYNIDAKEINLSYDNDKLIKIETRENGGGHFDKFGNDDPNIVYYFKRGLE